MENPAIDSDAYNAVKEAMGDIFVDLIQTFQDYVPGQINKLGEAIAQSDSEGVFNAAHAIKSSSGTIGALGLASSAEHIEQLGRTGSIDGLDQQFENLQNLYQQAIEFLQRDNGA
ncbi:MAG: Hpt domain-containing protein [Gammaproteobacteria bacterium]